MQAAKYWSVADQRAGSFADLTGRCRVLMVLLTSILDFFHKLSKILPLKSNISYHIRMENAVFTLTF